MNINFLYDHHLHLSTTVPGVNVIKLDNNNLPIFLNICDKQRILVQFLIEGLIIIFKTSKLALISSIKKIITNLIIRYSVMT